MISSKKTAVFESTNMATTKYAERIFDAVNLDDDLENGVVGHLGDLANGYDNIYEFVPGVVAGKTTVIIDTPAWTEYNYKMTSQRRDNFINEVAVPFRVRTAKVTDEFAVSLEGFTDATKSVVSSATDFVDTPVYVKVDSTTGKLVASTTADSSAAFQGQIMRKRIVGATLSTPLRNYGDKYELFEIKVTTLK